ncbi:odorant receptor 43a-like, partial [Culex pipiens pallens]|uniref:odorant receptor 43a-like n=1 Tax=Culex pipiens pallens TaxID=42434 RepID=UPI001954D51B
VLFDHCTNFITWLPVMFVSVVLVNIGVLHTTTTETFYWNLIHHVSCLFKIVRQQISELDGIENKNKFQEKLSFIVEIHEVAFRSCRRLETALFALLGYLYTSCIVQICYLMFIFSIIRDDLSLLSMMGIAVQYNIFLIFAFSMLGTELIEASLSVADEVYNVRWYERSPEERRLLLSIQMRSQIEASMTAGKFFCVNRATFAMAMKTAFSYFTVIHQFYEQQ